MLHFRMKARSTMLFPSARHGGPTRSKSVLYSPSLRWLDIFNFTQKEVIDVAVDRTILH